MWNICGHFQGGGHLVRWATVVVVSLGTLAVKFDRIRVQRKGGDGGCLIIKVVIIYIINDDNDEKTYF